MADLLRGHPFDRVCEQNNIEYRLTKPNHPWNNGQVERINRTIKEATVNRYYYQNHRQLSEHLDKFILAYNFAKRLKILRGLTPYEFIIKSWSENSEIFYLDPSHFIPGLYNYMLSTEIICIKYNVGTCRLKRVPFALIVTLAHDVTLFLLLCGFI